MESANTINIAVAADSCFAPGMLVTVGSMLLNGSKTYKYHFYILDCGLKEKDKDALCQLVKKFGVEVEVVFMHPDLSRFYSLPAWRGNYSAYARLLLHEILPDVKYMLYTDVDTYWGCDCAGLWELRSDEKSILASSNSLERNFEGGFFNSAVYVINLERLRQNNFTVRMMEWSLGRELKYPDMEILNGVLVDDKVIIDSLWDMQEPVKWEQAFAKPCVIHYTRNKPWLSRTRTPYFVLSIPWWDFYFKYLGKGYSWRILLLYIRGKLRYNLFSRPGFLSKYAAFRKLKLEKRKLLEDMFTFDSSRNRGCWFATQNCAKPVEAQWDSRFFQRSVFKLEIAQAQDMFALEEWWRSAKDGAVCYVTCDMDVAEKTDNAVRRLGGKGYGTRVVFRRDIMDAEAAPEEADIKPIEELDDGVLKLAQDCGQMSRFCQDEHFAPYYRALYKRWIENGFDDRRQGSGEVFGYYDNGKLAGFVYVSLHGNCAKIELLVVGEKFRRKGIGQKLTMHAIGYARSNECTEMQVVTQGDNLSACKTYRTCGFKLVEQKAVFHLYRGVGNE